MSFDTALALTLLVAVFFLACAMANLLARITRLERFARDVLAAPPAAPVRLADRAAPDEVVALVKGRDQARLLFVSPDCPACDDAVEAVHDWPEAVRRSLFLVYRGEPTVGFAAPAGVRVAAQRAEVFDALSITATPAFVQVEGGMVTARSAGGLPPQVVNGDEPGHARHEARAGARHEETRA
jgi:hypothetical protein